MATLLFIISLLFRPKSSRILVFIMMLIALSSAFITLSKGAILMCLITISCYFVLGIVFFKRLVSGSKKSLIIVGSLILGSLAQFVLFLISQFNHHHIP